MASKEIRITYHRYDSLDELSEADQMLFNKAVEASKSAYAPYSDFSVGAAVLLKNDQIITGSNQENIAYPSGLCAERVALFAAASSFPGVPIISLAVAAKPLSPTEGSEVTPCGACRQVIYEYERILKSPIRIITGAPQGPVTVVDNAKSLLPMAFFDEGLGKDQP